MPPAPLARRSVRHEQKHHGLLPHRPGRRRRLLLLAVAGAVAARAAQTTRAQPPGLQPGQCRMVSIGNRCWCRTSDNDGTWDLTELAGTQTASGVGGNYWCAPPRHDRHVRCTTRSTLAAAVHDMGLHGRCACSEDTSLQITLHSRDPLQCFRVGGWVPV